MTSTRPWRTRHGRWPALGLVAALVAAGALVLAAARAQDPLQQAWAAAQAHDHYAIRGTTAAQVGEVRTTHVLQGSGRSDGTLSVVLDESPASPGRTLTITWPTVTATNATGEPLPAPDAYALALVLPAGDPLAFLPSAHAPRVGDVEPVGDRLCRRVDFLVSGLVYGAWWQRHQQYLPAGAGSGPLEKLSAEGAVWVEEATHLPCRISLRVALVRLAGEQAGVGEADWEYGGWGIP